MSSTALPSVKGKEVVLSAFVFFCFVRKDVQYPDVVILLITNGLYLGKVASQGEEESIWLWDARPHFPALPCPSSSPISLPQPIGPFSSLRLGNSHPPPECMCLLPVVHLHQQVGWVPVSDIGAPLGSPCTFDGFPVSFCSPLWTAFASCSYTRDSSCCTYGNKL